MYLYYDKNGILKEIVNDAPIIQYDSSQTAYVYIEKVDENGNILKNSDGEYISPVNTLSYRLNWFESQGTSKIQKSSIAQTVSAKTMGSIVPFDRRRDLRFFQYGSTYEFVVLNLGTASYSVQGANTESSSTVSYTLLDITGDVMLSMEYVPVVPVGSTTPAATKCIGQYVFTVNANGIVPHEQTSVSQFGYLLNQIDRNLNVFSGFTAEATAESGTTTSVSVTPSLVNDKAHLDFDFVLPKGDTGATGRGITSITGPATEGLVDTYTINYSDSTTSTFNVTNGKMGLWYPSVISQSAESSAPAVGDTFQALVTAFSRIPIQGEVVQTMWISHINVMYLCLATITNIDTTTNMATMTLTHVNRVNGTQGQVGTTPEISMYATATSTTSATPIVTVSKSGTLTEPRYDFAFSGLKGVKGDTGEKGDTGNPGSVLFYKNALNISTPTGGNVLTLDTGIFNVTPQPTQTAFAIVQNQTGTYFISLLINTVNSQNTTATVTSVSSSFKGAQGATGESYLTLTQIVELNAAPTSGTTFTRIGSYFNRSASVGENILFFVVKDTTTNYLYACSGTIISDSAGYTVQISSATKISGTNGVDGKDALMVKSIPTTSTVATSFTIQVYETRFNRTPVQGEYISNLLLQYTVDNSIYLCTGTLISVDTSGYTPLWTIRVGVANKLTGTNGTNGVDACMCNATGYLSTIAVNDYIYSDSSQTTLVFASSTFTKLNSSDCFIICSVAGTSYLVFAEKTFFAPGYKLQVKQFAQLGNSGTVSNWGDIGGTLSNQTDLQSALDAKVSTSSSASVVYATTNAGAQTTMSLIGGDGQESPSALTGVPVYTNGSLITSSPSYGYSCVNKNYMHTYVPQPTASTPTNAVLTKTSSGIAWQTVSGSGLDTFTYSGNNQAKIGYILKNCKGVVGAEIVITIGGSLEDGVGFHMSLPQVIGENYNNIDWEGSTSTVNGTFYAARFRYRSSDSAFVLAACTKMDCTTGQSIISQVNNGAFYSATITYLSSSVL